MPETSQDAENIAADQRDKNICPHEAYILVTWLPSTLVSSGSHMKIQTWRLKQQKVIFSKSGCWKSKIKVSSGLVSPEAWSPRLIDGWLLAVSTHGLFSMPVMSGGFLCVWCFF